MSGKAKQATITHGTITVMLDDYLAPPEDAGKLTTEQIMRMPKARRGIGLACQSAADAIDKVGKAFSTPSGITPASLREAGTRAEDIDRAINDVEVILSMLKQANLIFDAEAHRELGRVNDQVKAQAKDNPELLSVFRSVTDYFSRTAPTAKAPPTVVKPA